MILWDTPKHNPSNLALRNAVKNDPVATTWMGCSVGDWWRWAASLFWDAAGLCGRGSHGSQDRILLTHSHRASREVCTHSHTCVHMHTCMHTSQTHLWRMRIQCSFYNVCLASLLPTSIPWTITGQCLPVITTPGRQKQEAQEFSFLAIQWVWGQPGLYKILSQNKYMNEELRLTFILLVCHFVLASNWTWYLEHRDWVETFAILP